MKNVKFSDKNDIIFFEKNEPVSKLKKYNHIHPLFIMIGFILSVCVILYAIKDKT